MRYVIAPTGPERFALLTRKLGWIVLIVAFDAGATSPGTSMTMGVKTSKPMADVNDPVLAPSSARARQK